MPWRRESERESKGEKGRVMESAVAKREVTVVAVFVSPLSLSRRRAGRPWTARRSRATHTLRGDPAAASAQAPCAFGLGGEVRPRHARKDGASGCQHGIWREILIALLAAGHGAAVGRFPGYSGHKYRFAKESAMHAPQ